MKFSLMKKTAEAFSSDRIELEKALCRAVAGSYDFTYPEDDCGGMLRLVAEYHARLEKFVLVKSAQIWAAENNEYLFLFSVDKLDRARWDRMRAYALKEGLARVKPHKEHMYSYLTLVVLADAIEPEIRREIRRTRFMKNYRWSLYGFSTLRCAAYETATGTAVSNPRGGEVAKLLLKIYRREKR